MKKSPKISIIIPTLNEENYLPNLLDDIKKQTFKDYEVIVADAFSKDKTRRIAKKYGAKVIDGGTPPVGRNKGVKIAQGEFLFFLDADVRLPYNFLQKAYSELEERYLDLATCEFKPISSLLIDKVIFEVINLLMKASQFSNPHAPGYAIFVSKRLFERIKGFNESLKQAEDHDFVKRASFFRPLRVLNSTYIKVSVRRLDKEGRINLSKKYLRVELHRIFKGEIEEEIFDYEFGNYQKNKNKKLERSLARIERQLKIINNRYQRLMKMVKYPNWDKGYKRNLLIFKSQVEKIKNLFKNTFKK